MSTRLILIRHGETDWSLQKRYCGFTDICLNEKGVEQAERLCQRLAGEKIDRVYCSDSSRTLEFAKIVFKNKPIESISELREMNFGIFEGRTHEEVLLRHPEVYAKWLKDPYCVTIPEGEGLGNFKKRIEKILDGVIPLNQNKTAAIVTHAGPIKIIMDRILDSKNIWETQPALASLSMIEFKNGKGEVLLFNDRSHLDG